MGNKSVNGYVDVIGKHGIWIGDHTGPASYVAGGETLTAQYFGLRSLDMANAMRSTNLAYSAVSISPTGNAGAISQNIKLLWQFASTGSVASVSQNAAGSGMTVGTTVPIVFSAPAAGGVQATGTLTVLTATTFSSVITNPGSGYTSAPTATVSGTGGTPPTLTSNLSTSGAQVAAGANLSGVSVRMIAIGG